MISKVDTVPEKKLNEIKKKMEESKQHYCIFSTDQKRRNILLDELQTKLKQLSDGLKKCVVVGKGNTGKHSLIKQFMKVAKFHN